MKNKILLIAGDPKSISSEIIFKTWKKLNNKLKKNIYLIGSFELITKQLQILKYKINTKKIANLNDRIDKNKLNIINIPLYFNNPFKISEKHSSQYIIKSLNLAHKLAGNKQVKGIINCPINKKLLKKSKKIGVTEF